MTVGLWHIRHLRQLLESSHFVALHILSVNNELADVIILQRPTVVVTVNETRTTGGAAETPTVTVERPRSLYPVSQLYQF